MAGYWRAWEAISGAYVILSGLGCCAGPAWQALTGKGEFGRARAHEKGHVRRRKIQASAQRHVRRPLL